MLILNVILFTSIFTEIFGSLATEYALIKSDEVKTRGRWKFLEGE